VNKAGRPGPLRFLIKKLCPLGMDINAFYFFIMAHIMGLEKGDAHWIETRACALNSTVIVNNFLIQK
jgi:hypothetical protein